LIKSIKRLFVDEVVAYSKSFAQKEKEKRMVEAAKAHNPFA